MKKSEVTMRIAFTLGIFVILVNTLHAQRQMEYLDRGVVAINQGDGKVYIGWRMFGTDPEEIAFNVYRDKTKINDRPVTNSTNFVDNNGSTDSVYTVRPVVNGQEGKPTTPVKVWKQNYI